MFVHVPACGAIGIVTDIDPDHIAPNGWTSAKNIRFMDNAAHKFLGHQELFVPSGVAPVYGLLPYQTSTEVSWFLGGEESIYQLSSSVYTNVSRSGDAYAAGAYPIWVGGTLNGVPIFHNLNRADPPQAWDSENEEFGDLDAWPTGMVAGVVRPYLQYLVALDVTNDSTRYPTMVKWSASAVPGNVPNYWEDSPGVFDPTKDAGEATLSDTPGPCVEMEPLADYNIIYKEDAVYAMQWVGGSQTFTFRRLFNNFGALAPRCVASIDGRHVVLSKDDVFVHNGGSFDPVAYGKIRRELFNAIDSTNYSHTFLAVNRPAHEVWVCIPQGLKSDGFTANDEGTCGLAYVWNYRTGQWGKRELPDISFATTGIIDVSSTVEDFKDPTDPPPDNVASEGVSFDIDVGPFDKQLYNPTINRMMMVRPISAAGEGDQPFYMYLVDSTGLFSTTNITTLLERRRLTVPDKIDTTSMKFVRAIYPAFDGDGTVLISVGTQLRASDSIDWRPNQTFVIGTDVKANFTASGRIISVRFKSTGTGTWKLNGYHVDMDVVSPF